MKKCSIKNNFEQENEKSLFQNAEKQIENNNSRKLILKSDSKRNVVIVLTNRTMLIVLFTLYPLPDLNIGILQCVKIQI